MVALAHISFSDDGDYKGSVGFEGGWEGMRVCGSFRRSIERCCGKLPNLCSGCNTFHHIVRHVLDSASTCVNNIEHPAVAGKPLCPSKVSAEDPPRPLHCR